jgi:DNA mismatch repair ATPase MutS
VITPFLIKLFKKFYKKQHMWSAFINCVSELDCLCSLAVVAKENNLVKPEILTLKESKGQPFIDIRDARHPCVEKIIKRYVPNDVSIGGEESLALLITGPNMGGKSTLLRSLCLNVIMA